MTGGATPVIRSDLQETVQQLLGSVGGILGLRKDIQRFTAGLYYEFAAYAKLKHPELQEMKRMARVGMKVLDLERGIRAIRALDPKSEQVEIDIMTTLVLDVVKFEIPLATKKSALRRWFERLPRRLSGEYFEPDPAHVAHLLALQDRR